MSTIKMQESTSNDEVVQLRKQAASKDNRSATLENELLKKNNDLLAVKSLLNETLCKLREEADRVLKLESDLDRQAEDLRSERLTRQNLEASLRSTNDKLTSEEQTAKYIQMELDTYASRMSSQHEQELKRLQHEKSTLEARVRALESQSQSHANKPSQLPTRLPRATTVSGAASTVLEARIATLESDLSKARLELADASRSLVAAQQDASKLPRLQSELIAADNARLRAEKVASAEKAKAENAKELLKEREEELEYWRSAASEKSVDEAKLEDVLKERDEAVRNEEDARRRENAMRKRIQELEESEAELVMEREEALNELHRLQAESPADSRAAESTIAELRSALAERESALLTTRGYAAELQHMYRDTLSACDDAEARVRDLELQLQPTKGNLPPLVIVSPPPSPAAPAPAPFLAQPKPMTRMSREEEAVVARLLSAIERLRVERDSLRRDLHFTQVEHRMAGDVLRARLDAAEREVPRLEKVIAAIKGSTDQRSNEGSNELRRLHEELAAWRNKFERTDAELIERTANLANNVAEMDSMRAHVQEVEDSQEKLIVSCKNSSRVAISSLIAIQHLRSELHQVEDRLAETSQTTDEASVTDQTLRAELADINARFEGAVKEVQQRDAQITEMHSKLSEFQNQVTNLESEHSEAHELNAAEIRYSMQQPSALSSYDTGAAEAMESQLHVLEQRILRRTEQIGMLQHDTKRLETNFRVAEETIGELAAELETLGQERACLVDDCAQAREARDEALRRVEELEVETESFTNHYETLEETKAALQSAQAEVVTLTASLEAMVYIYAESVSRSRGLRSALTSTRARLTTTEANVALAEGQHSGALTEIERLSSRIDSMALTVHSKTADMDALTQVLTLAQEQTQRLTIALDCLKTEAQSREEDITGETQQLTATVKELKDQLAAEQSSRDALSQELETAQLKEKEIQATLERVQEESQLAIQEAQRLSSTVASLERELNQEQSSRSEAITQAQADFEKEISMLEAQVEKNRKQYISLQAEHANVVQDLACKLTEAKAHLARAREAAASRESLELDLRRLEAEHTDELLDLRSRLDESISQAESLRAEIQTATETIEDLESGIEASAGRYDAAQVEIHGLEQALEAARAHVDEHDASIQALQRERTALQIEQTRLEAELDRLATKYQYVEQQAKRSDHEVMRLKPELERLRGEVAKLDEAAQTAEINLSFKTNQYEQKLAMMQRETQKQQSHRQCQETIAELSEKIEYLEEMLKMKSVEIEENDDRFIEALKEKKRLTSKVDSLTRKVQSLQTKMAAFTTAAPPSSSPPESVLRPKTPSPAMPSIPSAGPSTHAPTRIPSSPAVALRSKTPEPPRKTFVSRIATPEPHVPPLPNVTYKTPDQPRPASRVDRPAEAAYSFSHGKSASPTPLSSGSKKRRAPDDFDSPAPGPVEAIVASNGNTTPRHVRLPTNDRRSGFTPARNSAAGSQRPMLPQPSPLKRSAAPLAESTNSPRGNRPIGLGKPASVSKPPVRSWLSRTRGPVNASAEIRSTSALGVRPT